RGLGREDEQGGLAMALVDYFLKIDGIAGESVDDKHKGEIEVDSFSFGVENRTTIGSATGGAGAGKVRFNHFTIKKTTDKPSPLLFQKCATGVHLKDATLTCRKAGQEPQEFLKIRMSDVLVSTYAIAGALLPAVTPPPELQVGDVASDALSTGGGSGGGLPIDSVGLSFRSVPVTNAPPSRTSVAPTAGGVTAFGTKSHGITVGEGPTRRGTAGVPTRPGL